jgi:uncharacterized membrane protein
MMLNTWMLAEKTFDPYRINLKAELEVAHLHKRIDRIWEEVQAQLARPKRPG